MFNRGDEIECTYASGDTVRLRGPWHGGAPEGFSEVYYWIDKEGEHRSQLRRPWHARGGYFGLYVGTDLLLDIFATFVPHVGWCHETTVTRSGEDVSLRPLRPETGLPKGWHADPEECPGHRYTNTSGSWGAPKQFPSDSCDLCGQRRDPGFKFPHEMAAA